MENSNLLTALPIKSGRYIILDTETTGVNPDRNNIIELACIEISKGKITGSQFHCYLRPRHRIDIKAQAKHKLPPTFYEDYFSDVYHSDKASLENFLKFIGNSLVFAHNATFDINFINNELRYWNLPTIPKGRFRCTMRLFKNIFGNIDHRLKKYCSLAKCCEFFNLKSTMENFHSAIFDSFMTARLVCKFYEFIETYNINMSNLSSMNLTLINIDKIFNVQNIVVQTGRKVAHDLNFNVDELIHKENINPNEIKNDDEEFEVPDDIMNILEEHGDFIENYMNDGEGDKQEEVDINMVDCLKEEEKVFVKDDSSVDMMKNRYKMMMRNFYDESSKKEVEVTEGVVDIQDIIKKDI
jgi:DNA polymerase-3 subunit epsilon